MRHNKTLILIQMDVCLPNTAAPHASTRITPFLPYAQAQANMDDVIEIL